nr:MAG TPA: hypothetical protein [Caudoviricetes sp.]
MFLCEWATEMGVWMQSTIYYRFFERGKYFVKLK